MESGLHGRTHVKPLLDMRGSTATSSAGMLVPATRSSPNHELLLADTRRGFHKPWLANRRVSWTIALHYKSLRAKPLSKPLKGFPSTSVRRRRPAHVAALDPCGALVGEGDVTLHSCNEVNEPVAPASWLREPGRQAHVSNPRMLAHSPEPPNVSARPSPASYCAVVMVGEDSHDIGEDGVRRAKTWLLRSTRVKDAWTRHDTLQRRLLEYRWPHHDGSFSFDLGGQFIGGELEQDGFLAEVKNYKNGSRLGSHFRDFLAKSYVAAQVNDLSRTHFLWIAWAPFDANKWDEHCQASTSRNAILHDDYRHRVTGQVDVDLADKSVDIDLLNSVSSHLWMVTMSTRQEELVPTEEHYELIRGRIAAGDVGAR